MSDKIPFEFDLDKYNFCLPKQMIAQMPVAQRSKSRLLVLDRGQKSLSNSKFQNLVEWLPSNCLLVTNNSRVFPARFMGTKAHSGGRVEFLMLTPLAKIVQTVSNLTDKKVVVQGLIRPAKNIKSGQLILFDNHLRLKIIKKQDYGQIEGLLTWSGDLKSLIHKKGKLPLPPYIRREVEITDYSNYQTIFARKDKEGSVAAPTAGLHFTPELLDALVRKGVVITSITLYVGYGTFSPIRTKDIRKHKMHYEYYELSPEAANLILKSKQEGRKIVAVGTTTVRALEAIMRSKGAIVPYHGSTNLFIYPGFEFKIVDHMITNFHLPKSSLLVLVAAFAGQNQILQAYQHAVKEGYRFFSYGDAMLIL